MVARSELGGQEVECEVEVRIVQIRVEGAEQTASDRGKLDADHVGAGPG